MSTFEQLKQVFENTFSEDYVFSENLTANDIEDWDSLNHISLILGIEKSFNIKLNPVQVAKSKNVGELIKIIEQQKQ